MTETEIARMKEVRNQVMNLFMALDDLVIGVDPAIREGAIAILGSRYPRTIRPLAQGAAVAPAPKSA